MKKTLLIILASALFIAGCNSPEPQRTPTQKCSDATNKTQSSLGSMIHYMERYDNMGIVKHTKLFRNSYFEFRKECKHVLPISNYNKLSRIYSDVIRDAEKRGHLPYN